jgi:hypothetical protein
VIMSLPDSLAATVEPVAAFVPVAFGRFKALKRLGNSSSLAVRGRGGDWSFAPLVGEKGRHAVGRANVASGAAPCHYGRR